MSRRARTRVLLLVLALAPAASAQSDDCATPTPIVGLGTFSFDNSTATTGTHGQMNPFCPTIGRDVWFVWTAPSTGLAHLALCAQTTIDSNIAAHAGSTCPVVVSITCDDDSCGLQSQISWPVTAGAVFLLQIGASGGAVGGSGAFTLDVIGPPANDDCATPLLIGSSSGASFDNTQATTGTAGQTNPGCPNVTDDVWFQWIAPLTGNATIETCGQTGADTNLAVYVGAGCPTLAAIACDDNACGFQSRASWPVVGGAVYMLQIGGTPGTSGVTGSFTIDLVPSGPTGIAYCFGDGSGSACPCGNSGSTGNGCANSVAASGAHLDAVGNAALSFDTVELRGSSMPASGTALYFQGTTRTNGGLGSAFGDGLRCASGTIVRLGTRTNSGGASGYGAPLGDISVSVRGLVPIAGGTRMYQAWYRNALSFCTSATFNLTNGYEIAWTP